MEFSLVPFLVHLSRACLCVIFLWDGLMRGFGIRTD